MDLPPSGWYPDPYGAPELLRWWDGSTWTHHTHPGVARRDGGRGRQRRRRRLAAGPGARIVAQTTVGRIRRGAGGRPGTG